MWKCESFPCKVWKFKVQRVNVKLWKFSLQCLKVESATCESVKVFPAKFESATCERESVKVFRAMFESSKCNVWKCESFPCNVWKINILVKNHLHDNDHHCHSKNTKIMIHCTNIHSFILITRLPLVRLEESKRRHLMCSATKGSQCPDSFWEEE